MAPRWQTLLDEPDEEVGPGAAPDMIIEDAINVPEAPLGRSISMAEVRADTPEAPPGGDWLRGLMAADDPTGFSTHASTAAPEELGNIPGMVNSAAAGGVHGTVAGLERLVPGVREWSVEAEREHSTAFMGGDVLSNLNPYSPLNKLGGVTKGIRASSGLATAGKIAADVGLQTGINVADSAARRYGDAADNPEYGVLDAVKDTSPLEAVAAAALATPGAVLGGAGARSHYKQTRPEELSLRDLDYKDARYRSAGLDPTAVKQLAPEKQAEILAQIEMLNGQGGEGLFDAASIKQMNLRAHNAAAMARSEKDAAIDALSQLDAQVDPDVIASGVRQDFRRGQGPNVADHNLRTDRVAQEYNDMPRALQPLPPAPPTAAAQGLPPPPLPAGPPPLPQAVAAPLPPPAPPPVASARYQPQASAAAPPAPSPPRPSARAPQPAPKRMISHSNVEPPPDPVGALAAQGAPPPPEDLALLMEQEMLPEFEATPGAMSPDELIEQDIAAQLEREAMGGPPAPRPSARYAPPPDDTGFLMGNQVQGPGVPSARYTPPVAPAQQQASAIAALAASAPAPAAAPPMAAPAAAPPPMGPPTSGAMQGPLAQRGMSVGDFSDEKDLVGGQIDLLNKGAENKRLQHQYGALMNAAREGFPQATPQTPFRHPDELTQQWDRANADEGILNIIATEGQRAADSSNPRWISALGGLGSAASVGAHALGAVGAPTAVGLGAGVAAGRWALPRAHALEANWLSRDTAAMMDRLSGLGQKPVGSLTSSFGDMMRKPPPPPPPAAPKDDEHSGLPAGMTLGRDTTQAMLNNSQAFMPYASDYSKSGSDDARAATTERLVRTDPKFYDTVYEPLLQRGKSENA